MSEPTRKKDKSVNYPPLKIVSAGAISSGHLDNDEEFCFWTLHPKNAAYVDLSILATGYDPSTRTGRGSAGRKFSGRPELLRQLMPSIRLSWLGYSEVSAGDNLRSLRRWWCLLDTVEAKNSHLPSFGRVISVEDLCELHAAVARMEITQPAEHHDFVRIVNLCLKDLGRAPLYWHAPSPIEKNTELPEFWEIEKIRLQLKRRYFSALDRWEEADGAAEQHVTVKEAIDGQNPHACYRLTAEALGNPNPDPPSVWKYLASHGFHDRPWKIQEGACGVYPGPTDIKSAFLLALLVSGWNAQTLFSLDLSGDYIEPHPSSSGYHIVWAEKNRGNSIHFVVGRDKRSDSVGAILKTLELRTKPLRQKILAQLRDIDVEIARDPRNPKLLRKRKELEKASKSPWLYIDGWSPGKISCLKDSSTLNIDTDGSSFMKGLIRDINLLSKDGKMVREDITPSDFRDAYIGFAYEFSNFNILAAQVAATHKNVSSTLRYLRQRQWRAHSAKKIRTFTEALWSEIENKRVVDPAILRGLVERGEVTKEQRIRWDLHKDRTRVGLGCKNFKNPPKHIAPQHVEGTGCRVQRCTLCEMGIVFDDSLDHLCRRVAELEHIRTQIPVPSWGISGFSLELTATENVLHSFEQSLVEGRIFHWKSQIVLGVHRVPDMEGAYD